LIYSINLKVKDEKDLELEYMSSVGELLGKSLEIDLAIVEAKDIP
jgi:hypothetical protein